MVHQPSQSGEIEEKPSRRSRIGHILFDTFVMIVVALATFAFLRLTIIKPENREVNNPSVINKVPMGDEDADDDDVDTDNNEEDKGEKNDDDSNNQD